MFGKHGQVGSQLCSLLGDDRETRLIALDIEDLDLTDLGAVEDCLHQNNPDWVINASAHTAVDRAESETTLAYQLNADAPDVMAKTCASINAMLIHYSTDYVFDGSATEPYTESDEPNPQSVYGQSKLAGEVAVLSHLPDAIIFRTAWVYSKNGRNFVNTMLRLAGENQSIKVVDDQWGSPTLADELAVITINVMQGILSGKFPHRGGVFHATGQGRTNWYGFCQRIMAMSGNGHIEVSPIPTSAYPTPAPRPLYSVLNNDKLQQVYAQQLPHWEASLERCLSQ